MGFKEVEAKEHGRQQEQLSGCEEPPRELPRMFSALFLFLIQDN